jgi:hypothetical protein
MYRYRYVVHIYGTSNEWNFCRKKTYCEATTAALTELFRINWSNEWNFVGKKANCEAAAAALKELVPITAEVIVPYEFHRSAPVFLYLNMKLLKPIKTFLGNLTRILNVQ